VYYTTAAWARAAGVGWESVANQLEKAAAWIVPRESIADRLGIYCKSVFKNGEPAPSSSSRYDPPRHPSMHLSLLYNTIII